MSNKNFFLFFFVSCLAITAFLVGYLAADKDFLTNRQDVRGQILDRFNETLKSSPVNGKTQLTQGPVISFDLKGGRVLYVAQNGQVAEVDIETGTRRIISNAIILNIFRIIWAPNSEYLLYEVSRNSGNRFIFLNLTTGKQWELDPNIESAAFSPDSSKFAYITRVGEVGTVFIHQSNSSEFKKVAILRAPAIRLTWPKEEVIRLESYSTTGSRVVFGLNMAGQLTTLNSGEIAPLGEAGDKKITDALSGYSVVQNEDDKRLYLIK